MEYKLFLMLFLINQGELEFLKKKSMEKWDQVKSSHVVFFVEDSFFGSEKAKEKSDKYKWEIWNSDEKVKIRNNRVNGIPFDGFFIPKYLVMDLSSMAKKMLRQSLFQ
jgi:hypothetical protein